MRRLWSVVAVIAALCSISLTAKQGQQLQQGPPGRGGPAGPPASGRAQAPFDLSGYWVSLVTDDWRYRMLTPPKGNADYLPVNAEARRVMGEWDPARDEAAGEACRAYGAGGVMRARCATTMSGFGWRTSACRWRSTTTRGLCNRIPA